MTGRDFARIDLDGLQIEIQRDDGLGCRVVLARPGVPIAALPDAGDAFGTSSARIRAASAAFDRDFSALPA